MENQKTHRREYSDVKKHRYATLRKRLRQNFRKLTESSRIRQEDAIRRGHIRSYNPLIDSEDRRSSYYRSGSSLTAIFSDGVFYKNPVLVHALGVASIVGAGTSLKNGIALSLLTFALLFPINLLASFLGRHFKPAQRLALYVVLSSMLLIPASSYLQYHYPDILNSLGIFLPLVSVSALISVRAEVFAIRNSLARTAVDSFAAGLGFAIIICLISAVREFLAAGTIGGIQIQNSGSFSPASMSFFGFILLGFFAAGLRMLRSRAIIRKMENAEKGGRSQ